VVPGVAGSTEILGQWQSSSRYLHFLLITDDETELSWLLRSWPKHDAPKLVQPFLFRLYY
jgi:hypothetical protein